MASVCSVSWFVLGTLGRYPFRKAHAYPAPSSLKEELFFHKGVSFIKLVLVFIFRSLHNAEKWDKLKAFCVISHQDF